MLMATYTDRYKGFQIRDPVYLGEPPKDIPPTYDVVKWEQHEPCEVIDAKTGEKKIATEHCYTVGWLVYDEKEPCFDFKSCGLRWLEEEPTPDVSHWLVKWAEYKLWELDKDDDY